MNKHKQIKLLVSCAGLLANKRVCNEKSVMNWWKIVKFCHFRGYLYTGFDEAGDIDSVAIAYRVSKIDPKEGDVIPEEENGNILYVLACASKARDKMKLKRLLSWYMRENPDVTTMYYHRRNSEQMEILDLRRNRNGKAVKT